MKKIGVLVVLVAVSIFSFLSLGCGAVVGGAVGGMIVAEETKKELKNKRVEGKILGEVDPDSTVVKLWLCEQGAYVFGNEICNMRPDDVRTDLQATVRLRFPNYTIEKIERTKDVYDIFYVHLRKR